MSRSHRRRDRASITRDVQIPQYRSLPNFEYAVMNNVSAHSGTVEFGREQPSNADRPGKPTSGFSGAALKAIAEANMRRVVHIVVQAIIERWSVSKFLWRVPREIHRGVPNAYRLRVLRTHDTGRPYGCKANNVTRRWQEFQRTLAARLAKREDPVEVCAWAEYEIRFGIHPLGDGCGRLATATAAWIMLRHGRRIPVYAIAQRTEFHEALRLDLDGFSSFYRRLCPSETEADEPHGPFVQATAHRVVA